MDQQIDIELRLTPIQIINLLKYINSIDKLTMKELLGVEFWNVSEEFESIWRSFQISPFHGLCRLDNNNLNKLFIYLNTKE